MFGRRYWKKSAHQFNLISSVHRTPYLSVCTTYSIKRGKSADSGWAYYVRSSNRLHAVSYTQRLLRSISTGERWHRSRKSPDSARGIRQNWLVFFHTIIVFDAGLMQKYCTPCLSFRRRRQAYSTRLHNIIKTTIIIIIIIICGGGGMVRVTETRDGRTDGRAEEINNRVVSIIIVDRVRVHTKRHVSDGRPPHGREDSRDVK